jgi:hypothetical protein
MSRRVATELPVLVVSCDRYADLWRPFFELFWRRWRDCSGPVYLGTNYQSFDDPRVQTLRVGADVNWAGGVISMLDRIRTDYVIVMLEDFLLMETVDNARIQRLANIASSEGLGCLRLYSIFPPETIVTRYPGLGVFVPGAKWRVTAQAAIWNVATLRRLLVPGFSAWDFELIGSQMSDFMSDQIWGVIRPALVYDHAIEKGKWRPQGLAICSAAGVRVDLERRKAFSAEELESHEKSRSASSKFAERKTRALARFRQGRRVEGLRDMRWCLRRQPKSIQLWVIAAAGLIGPAPVLWLQRLHLRMRVAAASRAYRRALRSMETRLG